MANKNSSKLTDLQVLLLIGVIRFIVHMVTNGQYGFHRDELALIDNARRLAWGYVEYPPLSAFFARLSLEVFGLSLVGIRFWTALAQAVATVLTGLMAKELGGGRLAQVLAAVSASIALMALIMGAMFQYIGLDYLWWVLAAYAVMRLVKSENPRWWLAVGAAIGLGMLTKYTIAFLVVGIAAGVLLTHLRADLRNPWLWGGAVLSLILYSPNLLWQIQNGFISLDFLSSIHARDIAVGRADGYLSQQLYVSANPVTLPIWLMGLYYLGLSESGKRYRVFAYMYLVPLVLMLAARGRFYYLAPAYPMLLAAGSVVWERWARGLDDARRRLTWGLTWGAVGVGGAFAAAVMLPVAPVGSGLFDFASGLHDNFVEQIGWQELVAEVAGIYHALPNGERAQTGILVGNFGEAGAINLYGTDHLLPEAISGVNSYWSRGYGDPPPETLIVVGFPEEEVKRIFETCSLAGENSNRYGVMNEESLFHPDIFVCRGMKFPWPDFWESFRYYA